MTDAWSQVYWQDVTWRMPSGWELLRYGSNRRRGSCAAVDRYAERMQVGWNRTLDALDLRRLVDDQRTAREQHEQVVCQTQPPTGGWLGYTVQPEGAPVNNSRWARWFSAEQTLLEVLFNWPEGYDPGLEQQLLQGIDLDTAGPRAHWQAFGVQLELDRQLGLKKCQVQPGMVELRFETPRGTRFCEVRRLGLPQLWLKQPVNQWLRAQAQLKRAAEVPDPGAGSTGPASVATLAQHQRRPGWLGLLGARSWHRDLAWHCQVSQRVYRLTVGAPDRQQLLQLPVRLRCECGVCVESGGS